LDAVEAKAASAASAASTAASDAAVEFNAAQRAAVDAASAAAIAAEKAVEDAVDEANRLAVEAAETLVDTAEQALEEVYKTAGGLLDLIGLDSLLETVCSTLIEAKVIVGEPSETIGEPAEGVDDCVKMLELSQNTVAAAAGEGYSEECKDYNKFRKAGCNLKEFGVDVYQTGKVVRPTVVKTVVKASFKLIKSLFSRRLDEGNMTGGNSTAGNSTRKLVIEYEVFVNVTGMDPGEIGGFLELSKKAAVGGLQKSLASGSFNKAFVSSLEEEGLGNMVSIDSNASAAQIVAAPAVIILATSRPTLSPTPAPTPAPRQRNINGYLKGRWTVGTFSLIIFVFVIASLAYFAVCFGVAACLLRKRLRTVHVDLDTADGNAEAGVIPTKEPLPPLKRLTT